MDTNTYTFYELAKILKTTPLDCLREYRNLCSEWEILSGENTPSLNLDSQISREDAEILITVLTGKTCIELLLDRSLL